MGDIDECYCNEGWCIAREVAGGGYRRSYPFGGGHTLYSLQNAVTPTDNVVRAHKALLEGKPGLFGYLWGDYNVAGRDPEQVATTFPISPVVGGHCVWAATRHSTTPFTRLQGCFLPDHTTYESTPPADRFQMTPVGINQVSRPLNQFACPVSNVPLFKTSSASTAADFNFISSKGVDPGHFWIPDPTPLAADDVIALLGAPGGDTPGMNALDLGGTASTAALITSLFTLNTKSLSCGTVIQALNSVVCHDASTNGGFCGSVGINISTCQGFKFSFIHATGYPLFEADPARLHNHGLSVLDPDFKAQYITHVLPIIRSAEASLSAAQKAAVQAYVGGAWPTT